MPRCSTFRESWVWCACCTQPFLESSPGRAPRCATDFIDGTGMVNFGSAFTTGLVLLASDPTCLELINGMLCDECIHVLLVEAILEIG
jgi:hypothetical protein